MENLIHLVFYSKNKILLPSNADLSSLAVVGMRSPSVTCGKIVIVKFGHPLIVKQRNDIAAPKNNDWLPINQSHPNLHSQKSWYEINNFN